MSEVCSQRKGSGLVMDEVFIYRVGGGADRHSWVVVTLDALPAWTTIAQIKHLANHSRVGSSHWVLRSSGKAMACKKFVRAVEVQTEWAKMLEPGERIALGRLAPHDATLEDGRC